MKVILRSIGLQKIDLRVIGPIYNGQMVNPWHQTPSGLQGRHDVIFSLALLSDYFHTWKEVSKWIYL